MGLCFVKIRNENSKYVLIDIKGYLIERSENNGFYIGGYDI